MCNKRVQIASKSRSKGQRKGRWYWINMMVNNGNIVTRVITFVALLSVGPGICLSQNPLTFKTVLRDNRVFSETHLTGIDRGDPLVKLLPSEEKREVAVGGLVRIETTAEELLKSFQENMARKNDPAILEIGKFGNPPAVGDLQMLTFEDRDLEDLKTCVVGNCKLKLSATMIERLHTDIDWEAADYKIRAASLLKQMLLDYVKDYLARGDPALIQYSDKQRESRVANDQRELMAASSFDALKIKTQDSKGSTEPKLEIVESAIVWSKIKFGLKPVIAINHITIYKTAGAPILILSKQIYANHYFDSSLALTAFLAGPESQVSYLFYENRSRLDGLGGMFGDFKRGIVEDRAVASLESILRHSQLSLKGRGSKSNYTSAVQIESGRNWRRWKVGRLTVLVLFLGLTGIAMFLGLRAYNFSSFNRGLHY
jgi:hypothetical protein